MATRLIIGIAVGAVLAWASVGLTSIYVHRYLAHQAFSMNSALARIMALATIALTGNNVDRWVALHRQHHRHPDRPGDPHSPHIDGFLSIFLGVRKSYRRMGKDAGLISRLRPGEQYRDQYRTLGSPILAPILLYFGMGLVLRDWFVLLIVAITHFGLGNLAGNSLAAVCHMYGTAPHPNPGTNVPMLGILTWGESFHNNHHKDPRNPRFCSGFGDLGGLAIQWIASERATPPAAVDQ